MRGGRAGTVFDAQVTELRVKNQQFQALAGCWPRGVPAGGPFVSRLALPSRSRSFVVQLGFSLRRLRLRVVSTEPAARAASHPGVGEVGSSGEVLGHEQMFASGSRGEAKVRFSLIDDPPQPGIGSRQHKSGAARINAGPVALSKVWNLAESMRSLFVRAVPSNRGGLTMTTRELARKASRAAADLEQGITEERLTTLEGLLDRLQDRMEARPSRDPAVRTTLDAISETFGRMRERVTV